jgi:hypothetical protein
VITRAKITLDERAPLMVMRRAQEKMFWE